MKKYLTFTLIAVLLLNTLISCKKEDEKTDTFAKITVMHNGSTQATISVYMFDERKGPNTSFFTPFFSDKTVITESNGVATFNLQDTYDLEVIDNQTTLYFGVFDNVDNVLGQTAITIEKGQTKSATISY